MKRFFSLLVACLLIAGSLAMPAGAAPCEPVTQTIARATDQFKETISAHAIMTLGDSVSLEKGETVSYDCTYTPSSASVKFGYIGPDGLFCGIEGSRGSIDLSIRVAHRGSYTLAIWNKSDEAVTVKGTVNY